MELILFEGGDMDGKTTEVNGDLADERLFYDGIKTFGSSRGGYERTQAAVIIDGVRRTVWRAV